MKKSFEIPSRPWAMTAETCLEALRVDRERGLDEGEVKERQLFFGLNTFPTKKRKWLGLVFLEQFLNPLVGLLLVSGAIIAMLGDWGDAFVVWAVVVLNAVMGTIQEGRAERSIASLKKLSSPQTRVLRSGQEKILNVSELVPGDIVLLAAGDAVPADLRIIEAATAEVIEAVLTGEGFPVGKTSAPLPSAEALYEKGNMLFSGTHLTKGRCIGVVTHTGVNSEMGKIAMLLETAPEPKTPIEMKIAQFGRHLIGAAILIFIAFFGIGFLQDLPVKDIFMAAVSQLVSIIPEGLPVAITIALAVGVQRMAKHGALMRRIYAVETLGSTNVICTDKTGTLTKNEMTVTEVALPDQAPYIVEGVGYTPEGDLYQEGQKISLNNHEDVSHFLEACILCNDANIVLKNEKWTPLGDPMEAALVVLAKKAGYDVDNSRQRHMRLGEVPFDSVHKMMATYHEDFSIVKGALEEVLTLCNSAYVMGSVVPLSDSLKQQIEHEALIASSKGKRILGFARASGSFAEEEGIDGLRGKAIWLGFVAIMDPPREGVLEAVALCRKAHIRPAMLTGDHLTTAVAIAEELGIMRENDIGIDGKQLSALSEKEFRDKCDHIAVYARLQPDQKYYVVQTLQEKGNIVAMTGDGVNDAPALAKADVGVAMGTGTDVAKEASKVILMDDSFATLVRAIEQGRLVYRNILKVVFYLLATTFAAAFVMILAVSLDYPLPMAAVQILWINVVTEGTVTINLVLDPPDGTEMDSPPLKRTDHILSRHNVIKLVWTILLIGGLLFGYFLFAQAQQHPHEMVQTEVFTLLAFCAWFKLLSTRSEVRSALSFDFLRNRYLVVGLLLSIFLQAAVIYNSELNIIFHTVPLSSIEVLRLLGIGSIVLWAEELRKWITANVRQSS